jgi:hypothetical protein
MEFGIHFLLHEGRGNKRVGPTPQRKKRGGAALYWTGEKGKKGNLKGVRSFKICAGIKLKG